MHEIESVTDNIVFMQEGSAIYNGRLSDFGEDRSENCFEIICNLSRKELFTLLEEYTPHVSIDSVIHNHYIVTIPRNVTSKMLTKLLAENDIDFCFFCRAINRVGTNIFASFITMNIFPNFA